MNCLQTNCGEYSHINWVENHWKLSFIRVGISLCYRWSRQNARVFAISLYVFPNTTNRLTANGSQYKYIELWKSSSTALMDFHNPGIEGCRLMDWRPYKADPQKLNIFEYCINGFYKCIAPGFWFCTVMFIIQTRLECSPFWAHHSFKWYQSIDDNSTQYDCIN